MRSEFRAAVIGAGPIGIETAIALQESGVDTVLLEAKQIGHTISRWPANTHFYSPPERVSLAGVPVHNRDQFPITGEEYLGYLRMLVEQFDLNLHNYEKVTEIKEQAGGFQLYTERKNAIQTYHCQTVIASTGGVAGTRLLGIPGETLPHVQHHFSGPHKYFRTHVLIVGGRNSAVESALRCWRAGARVTISYRQSKLDPSLIKPHLLEDILLRIKRDEIAFLPSTVPIEITPECVVLASTEKTGNPDRDYRKLDIDFVLLLTGFTADMDLLRSVGVSIFGEEQTPFYHEQTMETNIPGIYVAGTAAGGTMWRLKHAIYTSHDHVARIVKSITGQVPKRLGGAPNRNSDIS